MTSPCNLGLVLLPLLQTVLVVPAADVGELAGLRIEVSYAATPSEYDAILRRPATISGRTPSSLNVHRVDLFGLLRHTFGIAGAAVGLGRL